MSQDTTTGSERCENHPQREGERIGYHGPYCQECRDAIQEGRL